MRRFIPILLLILAVSSCKYEKLLKSRDYKLKYNKALEYYAQKDYTKAENLFEQLKPILRGTRQADTVYFYAAYCSFNQKSYLLAAHYFEEFKKYYGNSPFVEEAEYMNAYSVYKLSPRPSLDQTFSNQAIALFGIYLSRYPNSGRRAKCVEIVNELKNKLIEKSYQTGKLYYNLGDFRSAIIALNSSLEEFPETKYREDILFLVLKSKFLFAEGSITNKQTERYQSAIDEYYAFSGEFPESSRIKEAKKMFDISKSKLKN
ncbi:MAG: outer membrane protein assembly factor BamD [Bacteroidales bacterium]|nr:outer membrane protein assembly factor BamD [Bacteroidales bacterium]